MEVPMLLKEQDLLGILSKRLGLSCLDAKPFLTLWSSISTKLIELNSKEDAQLRVALVGKYTNLSDSYLSIAKALTHASIVVDKSVKVIWIEASDLEEIEGEDQSNNLTAWANLKSCHALVIAGGFGPRGTEGKIKAISYARLTGTPLLGLCLGLQLSVVEYARSVLGLQGANSEEMDPSTKHPVIIFMPEGSKTHKGGTMRVGLRETLVNDPKCLSYQLYREFSNRTKNDKSDESSDQNQLSIWERHRHRYEVNPIYVEKLEQAGLAFVGKDTRGERMEIIELPGKMNYHLTCFYLPSHSHIYRTSILCGYTISSRVQKPSDHSITFVCGLIKSCSKQTIQDQNQMNIISINS